MPDLISAFVALAMTLDDAVAASTICAAQAIGRERQFGSLQLGLKSMSMRHGPAPASLSSEGLSACESSS
jgi:hypothetical protein